MSVINRLQISQLAERVRVACELSIPVDVEEAVKRLGGMIEQVTDQGFEARIERFEDRFKITLSQDISERRKRFSIAHELGHLFLHMGYLIDKEKWERTGTYIDSVYYRYGYSQEEYEANEFAAAFLMPQAEFIRVAQSYFQNGVYAIDPITEHFQISSEAAINRGRWLGVFSWD